jgi:hypothetical protein
VLLAVAIGLVLAAEPIRRTPAFEGGLWLEGAAAAFAAAAALLGDPRTRRWLLYATMAGGFAQVGGTVLGWVSSWRGLDDLGMGFYAGAFTAYFLSRRLDPHWAALADRANAERAAAVNAARAKKHEENRAAWAAKQREYAAKQGKYAEERARRAADQGK